MDPNAIMFILPTVLFIIVGSISYGVWSFLNWQESRRNARFQRMLGR